VYQRIADMTRDLHCCRPPSVGSVVERLTWHAACEVPRARYASVTLTTSRLTVETMASTHRYPALLAVIQQRHHEGPCLNAALCQRTVRIDDLATDERWPRFRRDALEVTPIRSILSFPLFNSCRTTGALNVYADDADVFDEEAEEIGYVLAAHAAMVWDNARREDQFQSALASRDVIGQAKGILMARFDIDAADAFEMLKRLSQETNVKLVDVARRVAEMRTAKGISNVAES
jgi:GAF domain-containing protein